jgi:glycosyltransferase involved in cell wall biosynthesis
MDAQRRLARSASQRLRLWLTTVGLERFESNCLRSATGVFDISIVDLAFWKARGVSNIHWLPPSVNVPSPALSAGSLAALGAVYVGNLHTPNNVQGLLWFLEQVWPRVLARHPLAQATLAGSAPTDTVRQAVDKAKGIQLLANPEDVWALYRSATVLVNPVLVGSGVNIKSVEMMQMDCPIVSTSVGVGGLTPEIQKGFTIADDPQAFADAVAGALTGAPPRHDAQAREAGRRHFSSEAIEQVIELVDNGGLVSQRGSS